MQQDHSDGLWAPLTTEAPRRHLSHSGPLRANREPACHDVAGTRPHETACHSTAIDEERINAMSVEVVVAVIAVGVSVVNVLFAFRQARSAKQSAMSARVQAAAARDAVAAAREQVAAARRQNELQEQMWRDQAQPHVVADVRPDPGHGPLLQVVPEDRGSTIAWIEVFSPALTA